MLKVTLKHYIFDSAISAFFEKVIHNFTVRPVLFPLCYSKYINRDVVICLTDECVKDRNLSFGTVSGIFRSITNDSIVIETSKETGHGLGWDGLIYLYEADIYKLYT